MGQGDRFLRYRESVRRDRRIGRIFQLILSLEKLLDDHYLDKIAAARYSQTAPENIPAYLWAKETEIKNIRVIAVSKRNKGDKDHLRRLMRHGYIG